MDANQIAIQHAYRAFGMHAALRRLIKQLDRRAVAKLEAGCSNRLAAPVANCCPVPQGQRALTSEDIRQHVGNVVRRSRL